MGKRATGLPDNREDGILQPGRSITREVEEEINMLIQEINDKASEDNDYDNEPIKQPDPYWV